MFLPAVHTHPRLFGRVRAGHAQFTARRHGRGLPDGGARAKGLRDAVVQSTRSAQCTVAGRDVHRDQLRVRSVRGDRRGGGVLVARSGEGYG